MRKKEIRAIDAEFHWWPMPTVLSASEMALTGECYIGMDLSLKDKEIEFRTCLVHEQGHCELGAFYNRYSEHDVKGRAEHRADRWAFEMYLPAEELLAAMKDGCTHPWELAEQFGFTEAFINKALAFYREYRNVRFV